MPLSSWEAHKRCNDCKHFDMTENGYYCCQAYKTYCEEIEKCERKEE